ncbi:MAG TPA: hypothetical protein VHX86_20190 [Tepidisphaeraceae bacterium]|jgi:hypothetical protein|nr:hypothetical protein [Tepidisphaeraceae bacterium]
MTAELHETSTENGPAWHPQADMVLSALEAGSWFDERREQARTAYRAKVFLKLHTDGPDEPDRVLYTRDVSHRGIGFVTQDRLPLGYGGILKLPSPRTPGKMLSIQCTLFRCRLTAAGWYEGALQFNRHQWEFLVESGCGNLVGDEEDRGK